MVLNLQVQHSVTRLADVSKAIDDPRCGIKANTFGFVL
jgi:hypothetical protein